MRKPIGYIYPLLLIALVLGCQKGIKKHGMINKASYNDIQKGLKEHAMLNKAARNDLQDDKFRQICEEVTKEMDRLHIPGSAVGILYKDKEFTAGFGVTSVENPLPVKDETLFQIASITKTYVATAIMRLVEMGKVELDAPIRKYLPDLKLADETVAANVTLRHLLTHTGGWVGDYFNDFGPCEDALAKIVAELAYLPQITPLGEIYSYSNSGFYLAGRVIEVVTGKSFESALKELVFDPLGLKMSFFFADDVITHRFVMGHGVVVDKKPKVARRWASARAIRPAGGVVCNIKDLLRYARFHMGDGTALDGTRLLTKESLALMQTPFLPSSAIEMIGLSWNITTAKGIKVIAHGGNQNGQISDLRIASDERFAVAVLTNSGYGSILCNEICDLALKNYLGFTIPEAVPLDVPEEELTPYVGRYISDETICEISLRNGGLVLQITDNERYPTPDTPPSLHQLPLTRIAFYDKDKVILLDEPLKNLPLWGEFLHNPDGTISWFRFGYRVHSIERGQNSHSPKTGANNT